MNGNQMVMNGWQLARDVPPPIDGTVIVALGHVSMNLGEDRYDVVPFCDELHHDEELGWLDVNDQSVPHFEGDVLTILHWIGLPPSDGSDKSDKSDGLDASETFEEKEAA